MQITLNETNKSIASFYANGQQIKTNRTFKAAPGNFVNPTIKAQKNQLMGALIPVIEKGNGFAAGIESAIRQAFPLINFKIGNISDLKYPSIQKDKPLVYSRTSFRKEKPLTFLYLNFPAIIDISEKKSAKQNEGLSELIADNIAMANEPHFISKVIDKCTEMSAQTRELTLRSIKNIVNTCLKSFKINIDNEVLSKEQANAQSEIARRADNPVTLVSYNMDNVETKLCVILGKSQDEIRKAVSHEFTHTLNANSLWINNIYKEVYESDDAPIAQMDFGSIFSKLYEGDPNFLNRSVNSRGEEYEKLLKNMLDQVGTKRDRRLVFEQVFSNVSDEALAYSQTPNLFNEYANPVSNGSSSVYQIPIGWFFEDFYDFMLSVKNNENLLKSI